MVTDIVIGNLIFLNSLSPEERAIFDEGFDIISKVQREDWGETVHKAIQQAKDMNVEFIYLDDFALKVIVLPLHDEVFAATPKLKPNYDKIQAIGKEIKGGKN